MPGAVEKVQRLIDDAVSKGAKVLAGGKPGPANYEQQQQPDHSTAAAANGVPPPSPARVTRRSAAAAAAAATPGDEQGTGSSSSSVGGQFYPPTVIVGVTKDMDLYYEEAFGPVRLERCCCSLIIARITVVCKCNCSNPYCHEH